ncbi:rCG62883 [Rattus norvegicus]|uniref:RCG62883 n=1 Tax=Rattus norvegicus TaxID=10116 RepID=A6K5K3_RAT|nr:rCG62883 [Rattus norvegicus]
MLCLFRSLPPGKQSPELPVGPRPSTLASSLPPLSETASGPCTCPSLCFLSVWGTNPQYRRSP